MNAAIETTVVSRSPEVMRGAAVFAGTRVAVLAIIFLFLDIRANR